jgi:hypothetical protein
MRIARIVLVYYVYWSVYLFDLLTIAAYLTFNYAPFVPHWNPRLVVYEWLLPFTLTPAVAVTYGTYRSLVQRLKGKTKEDMQTLAPTMRRSGIKALALLAVLSAITIVILIRAA